MHIKRRLRILCAIFICALIFCSCQSNPVDDYPFISLDSDLEKEMTRIAIIVPNDVSPILMEKANDLSKAITNKTEVASFVQREYEATPKDAYVILLGAVNDLRSSSLMQELRANDYICSESDGLLVLGGKNDSSTIKAIEKFTNEILPVSTRYALIPNMGGFTYKDTYTISKYTLNGVALEDYIICIDTDNEQMLSYAKDMQDILARKTGYWLNIKSKNEIDDNWSTVEFKINTDKYENGIARITPTENGFMLSAKDLNGIDMATKKFVLLLVSDNASGVVEKSISRPIALAYSHATASLFSYVHDAEADLSAGSVADTLFPIKESYSDLILLGKLDPLSAKAYSENITAFERIDVGEPVYTFSNHSPTVVHCEETDGILIEGYKIDNGELTLAIVRISGRVDTETSISLPSSITQLSLPTVVIVHSIGNEKITISDPTSSYITQVFDTSEKYFTEEIRFTCYASIDCINVTIPNVTTTKNVQCLTITGKAIEI